MKKIIGIIVALVILVAAVFLVIKFVNPANDNSSQPSNSASESKSENVVKYTIDAMALKENPDMVKENVLPLVPEDGYVLKETEFEFNEGDTADILIEKVAEDKNFTTDIDKSQGFFLKSIANISNGDAGENSFWGIRVNGEAAQTGASDIVLKKGDSIELVFVLNYEDL